MRTIITLIYAFIFLTSDLWAQDKLKPVAGTPSNETYDLFTDSKGFLWIANDAGIYKYDGLSFTPYSHPQQSSISMTGILEDKHGKIWFNNFTGQIFYIAQGRMHLLEEYDTKHETAFPRMGLYKNLLIATSDKGLFVCNTDNMKCKYIIAHRSKASATTSITILKNKVVAYGAGNWFSYTPQEGLKPLKIRAQKALDIKRNSFTTAARSFNDTIFLFSNPANRLYKFVVHGDELKMADVKSYPSFINTVSVMKDRYLVNTVQESFDSQSLTSIKGHDLSSMAIDRSGRRWYGSLREGLLTGFGDAVQNAKIIPIDHGADLARLSVERHRKLILGTDGGKLLEYDPKAGVLKQLAELPDRHGGIHRLYFVSDDELLIGTSVDTYKYYFKTGEVTLMTGIRTIKQADAINQDHILAAANGLYILHSDLNARADNLPSLKQLSDQRVRAVIYMPSTKTIWASFKDGLYQIKPNGGSSPFRYLGQLVYASCLEKKNDQLIIGTFNNGLIIKDKRGIKHLTTGDGLLSDQISRIKVYGKHLWVLTTGKAQLWDLDTYNTIDSYEIPSRNDMYINDIQEIDGYCYAITEARIFQLPIHQPNKAIFAQLHLSSVIVNGRDTGTISGLILYHDQNDIEIRLQLPLLINSNDMSIKYRLNDGGKGKWIYSSPDNRRFHFSSLMPGTYQFEALGGLPQTGRYNSKFNYQFTILPAWWQTWWFAALLILCFIAVIWLIVRTYFLNQLNKQKAQFEQELAVNQERDRISTEMHDDISAGLSAIRLYTSSLRTNTNLSVENAATELTAMVGNLSEKIREVIWSLNPEFDLLSDTLYFIHANAINLFDHSNISLRFEMPAHIPQVKISGIYRRNLYLAIKEALHNTIKHSGANQVQVSCVFSDNHIAFVIKDNGVGLKDKAFINSQRGIKNIHNRVSFLNGKVELLDSNGLTINIILPMAN
jgi:ligand-binding sensor domain-containing protein/cbb3-type cytochrome oxidase subunit 3